MIVQFKHHRFILNTIYIFVCRHTQPCKAVLILTIMVGAPVLCVAKCINCEIHVRDVRNIRDESRFCGSWSVYNFRGL